MGLSPDELQAGREKALQRCQDEIRWYENVKRRQRLAHYALQASVIVLSGMTPLLILIDQLPKPLQALPAALAGMLAAINGVFHISENYARFAYTSEALKSERFRFETRTTRDYAAEVDDYKALDRFVSRIEELIMSDVSDWRQRIQKKEDQQ